MAPVALRRRGLLRHRIVGVTDFDQYALWTFKPALVAGAEVECPKCAAWTSVDDWRVSEVPCELCGDHAALVCPSCYEAFDHVWGEEFQTRAGAVVNV